MKKKHLTQIIDILEEIISIQLSNTNTLYSELEQCKRRDMRY